MQSNTRLHLAIIMDGNGRWAEARGWMRGEGHRAGITTVRVMVRAAPAQGVATLTLFAFAQANWRRPRTEIALLFGLLTRHLRAESARLHAEGVRLTVIGRRDRLPGGLAAAIAEVEAMTAANTGLHLRIALDYSARAAILDAARRNAGQGADGFARLIADAGAEEVDLLIRTGGEQRLSDFLLWECAHAELWFTPILWPDFCPADLAQALAWFRTRERRFGGLGRGAGPPKLSTVPVLGLRA